MKKILLLIGGMWAITAYGQFPDVVDSTFGNNGVAIFSPSATVNNVVGSAMVSTNDGTLVAGTTDGANDDIFVLKVDKNGKPDSSFFGSGKVIYDPQLGANDQVYNMDVQPDGKILLCGRTQGQTYTQSLVMRLNPDGSLDSTFNQQGWLKFSFVGNNNSAYKVRWYDNVIYVACSSTINNSSFIYMAALEDNGNFYGDFGMFGFEIININGNDKEVFRDFEITPNKEIVVLGTTNDGVKTHQFVQKVDSEGYIMNGFGTNGTYLYNTNNAVSLRGLELAPNGSIYLAGFENTGDFAGAIIKLTSGGQLDNTFASGNGKAFFNVTNKTESERFLDIKYVNDTVIHVLGMYTDDNNISHALTVVYKSNGLLNTNYLGNGYAYYTAPAGYNTYSFNDVCVNSDGSLVFVGQVIDDNLGASQVIMRKMKKYVPPTVYIGDKVFTDNSISLFPNPTSGVLQVKSLLKINDIRVYNTTGSLQAVLPGTIDNRYHLPAHLPGGLYYLMLNTSEGMHTEKILLQR